MQGVRPASPHASPGRGRKCLRQRDLGGSPGDLEDPQVASRNSRKPKRDGTLGPGAPLRVFRVPPNVGRTAATRVRGTNGVPFLGPFFREE